MRPKIFVLINLRSSEYYNNLVPPKVAVSSVKLGTHNNRQSEL